MARKGENIFKRKDGRWEGRYIKMRENGKAIYGFVFGKSYSEAKKKKAEAMAGLSSSARPTSHKILRPVSQVSGQLNRYVHPSMKTKRENMEKLNELF